MKARMISTTAAVFALSLLLSSAAYSLTADSVRSHDIKEADGTSGQDTNSGSGIKTDHIQNRAVTAGKIAFYGNVIVVAPSGGNFSDFSSALGSITDSSATNTYLVKVMPGVYELPPPPYNAVVNSYVSIEGSGKAATILSCVSDGSSDSLRPCLSMAGTNTQISNLSMVMTGNASQGFDAVGFHMHGNPTFSEMDIYVYGGSNDVGLKNLGADATVTNVNIYTDGTGILSKSYQGSGRLNASGLKVEGINGYSPAYGIRVYDDGGSVGVMSSEIQGGLAADTGNIRAATSMIGGGVSGNVKLVHCYDPNFDAIANQ